MDDLTEEQGSANDLSEKKSQLSLLLAPSSSSSTSSSPSSTTSSLAKDLLKKQYSASEPHRNDNDNVSCTSSVLEFEKLEMQCSSDSFEERSKADEMEFLEDDEDASNLIRKNYDICHDLNTIYESYEKETNGSIDEMSANESQLSQINNILSFSLNDLKQSSEEPSRAAAETLNACAGLESTNLATSSVLTKSLSKIPSANTPKSSTLNLMNSSRSSSSSSVKSTDSFENELKCKFKVDEASFFAKKKLQKPTVSPPPVPTQIKIIESGSPVAEVPPAPALVQLDSGQCSMSTSVHSQLQSPHNQDNNVSINFCLINNNSNLILDATDEKFMSDLNKSMAKSDLKMPKLIKQTHSSSSSRQSRTSSSASSSSSTSLNESTNASSRHSTTSSASTVVHIMQPPLATLKKNNRTHVISAENLPSFRKNMSPVLFEQTGGAGVGCFVAKGQANTLVTSASFNSNLTEQKEFNSNTKNNNPDLSVKLKKINNSNPNISKSHSHHSNDCYCGKHSVMPHVRATEIKSFSNSSIGAAHSTPVDKTASSYASNGSGKP